MMKALLKQLHSPDIDLITFLPDDESNFGFLLEVSIGLEESEGADIFQLMVCTPAWLQSRCDPSKVLWGRHMLIVSCYDIAAITQEINKLIERSNESGWTAIAEKIGKFAHWEFEDYQP